MTEPKRRWRFQMHLSTAIVMMFVAGALFCVNWLNALRRPGSINLSGETLLTTQVTLGWPCGAVELLFIGDHDFAPDWFIDRPKLIVNISVFLAILFATWFLCEWFIRRRAARKES